MADGDIVEVEHIDFVIPEYSVKPSSLARQFSESFTPQPFSKKA